VTFPNPLKKTGKSPLLAVATTTGTTKFPGAAATPGAPFPRGALELAWELRPR